MEELELDKDLRLAFSIAAMKSPEGTREYLAVLHPKYEEVFTRKGSSHITKKVNNASTGLVVYVGLNGDSVHVIYREDATEVTVFALTHLCG